MSGGITGRRGLGDEPVRDVGIAALREADCLAQAAYATTDPANNSSR